MDSKALSKSRSASAQSVVQGLKTVFGCSVRSVLCRGVAKLVKASDFDSDMRGFESFLPCQTTTKAPAGFR